MWPGFLLKEVVKSSESGPLELAFSHLFVVLESGDEGMVDKDLLRNNDGKINNVTIILNAYDVQGSELRLTHSISLSPINNLCRKHLYYVCIPNKEIEAQGD